jgi:hypothetical protein
MIAKFLISSGTMPVAVTKLSVLEYGGVIMLSNMKGGSWYIHRNFRKIFKQDGYYDTSRMDISVSFRLSGRCF